MCVTIDAFKIGVALNLTSNASGALNVLARDFLGLRHHISGTMADLSRVQIAIAGLGAMTIGVGLLKFSKDLFEAGEDLVHQQTLLQAALGGTAEAHAQVARATQAAWDASRQVGGTTVAGNLEAVADLRNVFGSLSEAMQFMPKFQTMAQILSDVGGKVGEGGGGMAFLAARALELKGGLIGKDGQVDPAKLMSELDMMTRVMVATRGRVDPGKFLQFVQHARAAGMNLSDEALFGTIPALILAGGGSQMGTGLQTAWRTAVTGRMTRAGAQEAQRMGLLLPGGTTGGGMPTGFEHLAPWQRAQYAKANGIHLGTPEMAHTKGMLNNEEFSRDPVQWVIGTLLPALRSHGVTSDEGIAKEISKIFTDRTAAGFITEIARNAASIMKERGNIRQASGAFSNFDSDPHQAIRDVTSAWNNLLAALGAPMVRTGIGVLHNLTDVINDITKWIGVGHFDAAQVHQFLSNPFGGTPPEMRNDRAEMIGKVLAGLGAFFVAAGAIAIAGTVLSFMIGGGAAGALAAVVGGIAALSVALSYDDWKALWEGFLAPFRFLSEFLKGGEKSLPHEIQKKLEEDRRKPGGGERLGPNLLDPNRPGGPLQLQNYSPNVGKPQIIQIFLDGKEIGGQLVRTIVRGADAPIGGNPAFDGRRLYSA